MNNSSFDVVGKSVIGLEVKQKITGAAEYTSDMVLPNMAYGKILRSPYAHAKILSIDTGEAEKLPGVKAVITYEDTAKIPFGPGGIDDWYVLAKDKVRFIGDEVAAVAAVNEEIAEEALELIKVEYEELPAIVQLDDALKEAAPVVQENYPNNVAATKKIKRGNVEKAFEESDLIIKRKYKTSQQYQGYLENMAAIAQWDCDGNLTMWLPTQAAMRCRLLYAKALGINPGKFRIIQPHIGGGFGAKLEYISHVICAELARKAGQAVKIVNTKKEDMEAGNPRTPMNFEIELGLKRDGTITGKKVRILTRNGARTVAAPAVTATACYRIDALYDFKNVDAESKVLYTNTVPTSSMRGFGNAEMITAFEELFDEAAEALGIDPIEIRKKNAYKQGDVTCHGWEINTCGLIECLDRAREISQWDERRNNKKHGGNIRRGIGIAATMHTSGNRTIFKHFDGASALIRIGEEGQITLVHGECDMGQGENTVLSQIACEVLGAKIEDITVSTVDTQIADLGLGSFASRGTTIGGQGVIAAAEDAKKKVLETASRMTGKSPEEMDIKEGIIIEKESNKKLLTFAEATKEYAYTHAGMVVTGTGYWKPPTVIPDETMYGNVSPVYPYGAHIAEVEVDIETGDVHVCNYWAVHDSGKVINPTLIEGQVEGAIGQGIGWALSEGMIFGENGEILNNNLLDYRMPGIKEIPNIYLEFVETDDPNGPFGAKGIGEVSINPVAPAIVNAIYNAIGIRFYEIPVTPEKVLMALLEKNRKQ